ncbi:hypothetical protein ONE63_004901 [Megalurothrips usitatus]|uniref:Uncharacterized protein n=1 Tax=Megalurothrips usitatus TaxID=439358 RepID=A0AAV7X6N5_9NEOP|nr:hypothetical protein ONE63_004901 [Megalurothrips usitatus]
MTPIIAVFMSMISLLALVADRANLQEQVQGEGIPLPSVDDGVSRNFLDVAKRTLPLKMTPARTINMRRVPRAAATAAPAAADVLEHVRELQHDVLLQSLLIHALRRRDIREQLFAGRPTPASTSTSTE